MFKKFFKKIGKGFKEIGKGLQKFFTSKIGRILGTVMLVASMASLATNIFQGVGKKTLEETAKSAGSEVLEETSKEVVKETAKEASIIGAKESGKVVVNNISEALDVGQTLSESVGDVIVNNVTDLGKTIVDKGSITTGSEIVQEIGMDQIINQGSASISSGGMEALTLTNTPERAADYFSKFGAATSEDALRSTLKASDITANGFTTDTLKNLSSDAIRERVTDLATNEKFLASSIEQQQVALIKSFTPSKAEWSKALAKKSVRSTYDTLVGPEGLKFGSRVGETNFFAPSTPLDLPAIENVPGVREFGSMREAWQGGESLLSRTGNVIGHSLDTSISELTRGGYVGRGGTMSAAKTAYTGASVGANLLASPPEQPSYASGPTLGMASNILDTSSSITSNTSNTLSSMDYANAFNDYEGEDYLQLFNNINQQAGGHMYGQDAINTGFLG